MRYAEILSEAFDTVVPYRWEDHSNEDMRLLQANFTIADGDFIVQFKKPYYNPGLWEFTFVRNGELELSGTGSAQKVFATVIDIVRSFINDIGPRMITFAAKNDEPSRLKLYPKLLALLQREFPQYISKERPRRSHTHFDVALEEEYVTPHDNFYQMGQLGTDQWFR